MVNGGRERRMGSIMSPPQYHLSSHIAKYLYHFVSLFVSGLVSFTTICYYCLAILIDTGIELFQLVLSLCYFKYMVLGYSYIYRYIQYILLWISNI